MKSQASQCLVVNVAGIVFASYREYSVDTLVMCVLLLIAFFIPGVLSVFAVICLQAFSVMEQLRTHCATEISDLERLVGSQQELLDALNRTYPEQVTEQAKTKQLDLICLS